MKRPEGYYWVKINRLGWEIAKWELSWRNEYQWAFTGEELYKDDQDIDEIDERRIEREPSVEGKNVQFDIKPPNEAELKQYISDNPYICKPD